MGYTLNATKALITFIGLIVVSVVLGISLANISAYLMKFSLILVLIFYVFFIVMLLYGMNKVYNFFERFNKV